ncbi:MAG: ABC transporter permease [Chloroflexi bacterium]|nr:ABC transporter permease [Chloroflexota bacterium]
MKKIWVIARKEWGEVFRHRLVLFSVAFMPLIFSAIPLVMLYSIRGFTDLSALSEFSDLMGLASQFCGDLVGIECGQYLVLQQFMVLFLLLPAIIPVTIASYSIVGEKTTHTLEPLLATPITTAQLLAGKAIAAALPAIVATLIAFGIFAVGTSFLAASPAVALHLFSPLWMLGIFGVGPLLSIAGVSMAVMISSRVNDPRVAEQVSALVLLPVMAVFMGQIFGAVVLNLRLMGLIALAFIVVDAALLFFATQLFQRETILTRWK